jgi:hypothetical protein
MLTALAKDPADACVSTLASGKLSVPPARFHVAYTEEPARL